MSDKTNLMASFKVDGKEYEIIECSFGFSQPYNNNQPSGSPKIDLINMTLKVDGDTSLIDWMRVHAAIKQGIIHIKITESCYREIEFDRGFCISYNEKFDNYSSTSLLMNISILVDSIITIRGKGTSGLTDVTYDASKVDQE